MIACLRLFTALCLAALLAACASSLPPALANFHGPGCQHRATARTGHQAKTPEKLPVAPERGDLAYHQGNAGQSAQILQQVPIEQLKPGQQIFASTLSAELAMTRNQPKLR
jgi:outer membrane PBP1 activator LpoA protein